MEESSAGDSRISKYCTDILRDCAIVIERRGFIIHIGKGG